MYTNHDLIKINRKIIPTLNLNGRVRCNYTQLVVNKLISCMKKGKKIHTLKFIVLLVDCRNNVYAQYLVIRAHCSSSLPLPSYHVCDLVNMRD